MTHARFRLVALLTTALVLLGGCASAQQNPTVSSQPPAPPAPAAIPGQWTESTVDVPTESGAATYLAPSAPQRLRAALILGSPDKAGEVATRELAIMLAHNGMASLRFTAPAPEGQTYDAALQRASQGLAALAQKSGLGGDRLVVVGHGTAAPQSIALGTGTGGRTPMPIALVEPVLSELPAGTPNVYELAMGLPRLKHNLLTCSNDDIAVDCSAVQDLADVMTGTHVNYVRLRGVSHALQEDQSRDPARYGNEAPFSANLFRSLGTWVSMQ